MKLLLGGLLVACMFVANLAQDTSNWSVDGRHVLLNGEVFLFEGVNYAPVPIGASQAEDATNRGDVFTSDWNFLYERDLPAMRLMGANSLRVYNMYPWRFPSAAAPNWTQALDLDHKAFLDACWNGGNNPIFVWITYHMSTSFHVSTASSGPPDTRPTWRLTNGATAFMDPSWDSADASAQMLARNAFIALASKYGDHPAVSGFFISNEQNNDLVRGSWQFWKWFDETAKVVKEIAPTKLTGMTIVDDAMLSVQNAEAFDLKYLDVWGINSYRGSVNSGFDSLFSSFAATSNRPLIIGEFGPPASTRNDAGNAVEMPNRAKDQADYIQVHWEDIMNHRDICCGGLVFEWNDEWWKHGNPNVHDATPTRNPAYPGGWGDEEWFGINSVAMISSTSLPEEYATRGADVLTPRAAVETLSTLWSGAWPPAPPQAPPTPITYVPITPQAPLAPVQVPQNAPTDPITPTSGTVPQLTPTAPTSTTPTTTGNPSPSSPATVPIVAPTNRQSNDAARTPNALVLYLAAFPILSFLLGL